MIMNSEILLRDVTPIGLWTFYQSIKINKEKQMKP
jgi:hypothetical protein